MWNGTFSGAREPFLAWYYFCHQCNNVSLCFNGHFPSEPGLAGVYWSKGRWRWWWQLDYWSYKSCKALVKSSPPTNQHPVSFTGRMPFLSPNQQCQSTEGNTNVTMSHIYLLYSRTVHDYCWTLNDVVGMLLISDTRMINLEDGYKCEVYFGKHSVRSALFDG